VSARREGGGDGRNGACAQHEGAGGRRHHHLLVVTRLSPDRPQASADSPQTGLNNGAIEAQIGRLRQYAAENIS
jgi:hypothetical protein